MNQNTWNRLLSLESRDICQKWFTDIHSRELNTRRTREINAAAKQAREYFRNASLADYTVRPLLTFYGVASLGRALLLLLKRQGGEEGLTPSHGLEPVRWGSIMEGNTADALRNIPNLTIRTTGGLFHDFVTHTDNLMCVHINSGGVDWRLPYGIPDTGIELTFLDLISRIPDLQEHILEVSPSVQFASMNKCEYTADSGFSATVREEHFRYFQDVYLQIGYTSTVANGWCTITCDANTFEKNLPQLIHTYVYKMFGTIPALHLAAPFPRGARYSQLCITYMVSYVMGMLVRYYPTQWVSLIQGEAGDSLWPTINKAQQIVETSFPELVVELMSDNLNRCRTETPQKDGA